MDALSTLLMVIIFVLLVFVLAQAFLTVTLSGRSHELDKANQRLASLTDALSLERGKSADLQLSVSQLSKQLAARDRRTRQADIATRRREPGVQAATAANARLQSQLTDTRTGRRREGATGGCADPTRRDEEADRRSRNVQSILVQTIHDNLLNNEQ